MITAIFQQIRQVQQAVRHGSIHEQDVQITALHERLADCSVLLPSRFYPAGLAVLTYYQEVILPHLPLTPDDMAFLRQALTATMTRLDAQQSIVSTLERQFAHLITDVRQGVFPTGSDVLVTLHQIGADLPGVENLADLDRNDLKTLNQQYQRLKKAPFTARQVMPLFQAVWDHPAIATHVSLPALQTLFWDQLADALHPHAILVNPLIRVVELTRLEVETTLATADTDTLVFENPVDARMETSCWQAMQAARAYVRAHAPDQIRQRSLHVRCRFANPAADYNDASASLLVGLKIVGDVLDLAISPQTGVTGAVESTGQILPVDHLADKIAAMDRDPTIQRIIVPHRAFLPSGQRIEVRPVRTFAEAVEAYYGDALRKRVGGVTRRQILQGAIALTVAPVGLAAAKHFFSEKVTVSEHDWRLFECARDLYQQKSDYRSALTILDAIKDRFQEESATPAKHLLAFVLAELGVIYVQQDQKAQGLSALRQALTLWERLHDREQQIDLFLRIGDIYRAMVADDGQIAQGALGVQYYQRAGELLHPAMKTYKRLRGRCSAWSGYLYYWLGEYHQAEAYTLQGLEAFDEEHNWSYQTARQRFGEILIKVGKYDQAHQILEATAASPLLQSPYYQTRSLSGLSELYFAVGEPAKGVDLAEKALELCQQFGLTGQQRLINKVLAPYRTYSS